MGNQTTSDPASSLSVCTKIHSCCKRKVKGNTLKQSTAEPTNIPKRIIPIAASSKVPTALTMLLTPQMNKFKTKALVATDNNEDIDWTKEFDAEPVTYAMMALTGVEQDDWSMEFDAEHVHFGQDGLGDFDWSNKDDDTPVSLALMATNSEVPYCSKCSKSYKLLLENYQKERDNFQRARTEILGYQMSLESLEVMLKTHEKNEYAWGDKSRVTTAVLSRSTDGKFITRMDNRRPEISSLLTHQSRAIQIEDLKDYAIIDSWNALEV
ncbi:hypothetical protein Tco_1184957 [Tanacetum coccineum]